MTPLATLLWALVLAFDTFGQLSFKAAAVSGSDSDGIERWWVMLKNHWIWLGVFSYVFEFFLWLAFLSLVPLSMGVLMGCVNILTVMIGGRILFNEALTPKRIGAICMIALGVTLVGWS